MITHLYVGLNYHQIDMLSSYTYFLLIIINVKRSDDIYGLFYQIMSLKEGDDVRMDFYQNEQFNLSLIDFFFFQRYLMMKFN
jgi:hypothetical protein